MIEINVSKFPSKKHSLPLYSLALLVEGSSFTRTMFLGTGTKSHSCWFFELEFSWFISTAVIPSFLVLSQSKRIFCDIFLF